MFRMDQVHVVRYKVLVEGQSIRRVAHEMGISRNTIRKYLEVSEPVRREEGARARPVLEKVAPRINELLEEWSTRTTAKQRITGTRLHQRKLSVNPLLFWSAKFPAKALMEGIEEDIFHRERVTCVSIQLSPALGSVRHE